jgi:(p)ppGpp synthase/HD superfamily hydrolase
MNNAGNKMHADDVESRREGARLMGSARTEKKAEAARENQQKAVEAWSGASHSEETKAKLREAQKARRERERVERGETLAETPKRGRGRPRKVEQGND